MDEKASKRPCVALVIPPVAKACEPEPSVLVLAGHLKGKGIEARLFDVNLLVQELLLMPAALLESGKELSGSMRTSARRAAGRASTAFQELTGPAAYTDYRKYGSAINSLMEGFKAVSRGSGCRVTPSDFVHPSLSPLSSEDLARAAAFPELMPTRAPLEAAALEILAADPRIIGISLTYISQALHAWALAGILRNRGFTGPLILGGAMLTSWAGKLTPDSPALSAWDALIIGPGEQILEVVAKTGRIPDMGGVLSPGNGIWKPACKPDAEVGFLPEWRTLDWSRYPSPGGILPVAASRGCYWARCAFCPEADTAYIPAKAEALARVLLEAHEVGGVANVHFTDNALSPSHLRAFSGHFANRAIGWYGFARLESTLDEPGFMEALARGGCRMLQLGIETASQRLLEKMGKGTTIELADRIVRRAFDAGIRVYGYFLFGMVGETEEEARKTLDWIRERENFLTFLNLSIMNLPEAGIISSSPERYGLADISRLDDFNDLSLYVGHSGGGGMDRRAVRGLLGEARKDPVIRPMLGRTPRGFTSNHAAFAPLKGF